MPRCRALDRPRSRPRQTKHPQRISVEVNDQNRHVLVHMVSLLKRVQDLYEGDPSRHKQLLATRHSLALLRNLLDNNPRELMLDPDDFVKRGVLFFLDETCWGLVLKWQQQHLHWQQTVAARYTAGY